MAGKKVTANHTVVNPNTFQTLRESWVSQFMIPLALIGPVEITLRAIFTDTIRIFGHTLAVLAPLFLLGVAAGMWLINKQPARPNRFLSSFALLITALWLFVWVRETSGGLGYNFSIFVIVPAIWLIALKAPNFVDARRAADFFISGLAIAAALGTILYLVGYPLSNQFAGARPILGIVPNLFDHRWVGVFETTTQASAVGAYLLIYGLWRRSWIFSVIAIFGVGILFTGYSRGALAAAAAALMAALWFIPTVFGWNLSLLRRLLITISSIGVGSLLVLRSDPTMNGRTPIWDAYLTDLFPRSPVLGLGTPDLSNTIAADPQLSEIPAMSHAHNILLDGLARYGLFGLIIILALLVFAAHLAIRAGRLGLWVGPSLMVALTVNQFTDVHIDWRYLDYDYSVLIVAVVLSLAYTSKAQTPSRLPSGSSVNGTE